MTFAQFHNALRILHSVDMPDFEAAGLSCDPDASINIAGAWSRFQKSPLWFVIRADDQSAHALWQIIISRQPKE